MCLSRRSLGVVVVLLASCSSEPGETGQRHLDECESAVGNYAEPAVFDGASRAGSPPFVAALAFERETYVWNSGLKEGPRPDLEMIVRSTNDSDGFECAIIGMDGFAVATAISNGDSPPSIFYAKRESETHIAVMAGVGGQAPEHRLTLVVAPDTQAVSRLYPAEGGLVAAPGLSVNTESDGGGTICDHRSGLLRRFSASIATIETIDNGCENHSFQDTYEPSPPSVYRYDTHENRIEELWVDEAGRAGRTEYRNDLNESGDWKKRTLLMESAAWSNQREIREEYRHLRYRATDSQ